MRKKVLLPQSCVEIHSGLGDHEKKFYLILFEEYNFPFLKNGTHKKTGAEVAEAVHACCLKALMPQKYFRLPYYHFAHPFCY